jgi:hypothetical protein
VEEACPEQDIPTYFRIGNDHLDDTGIDMKEEPMTSPTYNGPNPAWLYPVRSPVEWEYRDDIIVLEYPKNLSKFEKRLNKVFKGPENIKRPLDEVGTLLWELSDGEHSLLEIFLYQQDRFHERVEPVDKIVGGLLENLLKLGLMQLEFHPGGKENNRPRTGKKMISRKPA